MNCVNLKERFGNRFKVEYEESYFAERTRKTIEDPWLMVLLCRRGHIAPWGDSTLAACTDSTYITNKLKLLPFTEVAQDGDDGANVLFNVEHFDAVAAIMKPRQRRQMTEEQKRQSAERLREYQFAKGQNVPGAAVQFTKSDQIGVSAG